MGWTVACCRARMIRELRGKYCYALTPSDAFANQKHTEEEESSGNIGWTDCQGTSAGRTAGRAVRDDRRNARGDLGTQVGDPGYQKGEGD